MGRLHQTGNLIIRVYANDHLPPHFHAIGPALFLIADLTIMVGALRPRERADVIAWAASNRELIAAEWNRINPRFPIA